MSFKFTNGRLQSNPPGANELKCIAKCLVGVTSGIIMAPNREQAITWSNDDHNPQHMKQPGHNELISL